MSELNPKVGDWIVYLNSETFIPDYASALVEKRTPKQIRVADSDRWGKVIHPLSVVAIMPDKGSARQLKQAIDGAVGTFMESRRKAEEAKSEAVTRARQALSKAVERLVSARLEGEEA